MCWVMPPAFALRDLRLADRVEERRLAVVDVTRDGDSPGPRGRAVAAGGFGRSLCQRLASSSSSSNETTAASTPTSFAIWIAVGASSVGLTVARTLVRHEEPLDVLGQDAELLGQLLDRHALGERRSVRSAWAS